MVLPVAAVAAALVHFPQEISARKMDALMIGRLLPMLYMQMITSIPWFQSLL
jgi:hypothetical protein